LQRGLSARIDNTADNTAVLYYLWCAQPFYTRSYTLGQANLIYSLSSSSYKTARGRQTIFHYSLLNSYKEWVFKNTFVLRRWSPKWLLLVQLKFW